MLLTRSMLRLAIEAAPAIEWTAVDACPSREEVLAMTTGLVAAEADWTGVSAAARVHADQAGLALELEIAIAGASPQIHRLSAPTCAPLAKATALLVAIAVDPIAIAERVPPVAASPQVPEPPDDPVSAPLTAPAPPQTTIARATRPRRPRASFGVFAGPGIGIGPGVTGVFGARAGIGWPRARIELGGRQTLPTTAVYEDRPGLGARIRGWAVHARGCFVAPVGPVSIPLCAGALAGRTRANGQGTDADRVVHVTRLAAVASASVRWRFARRVVLVGGVDLEAPLARQPFHIDEFREPVRVVYVEPAVGVIPNVGVEIELP